jgi:hypothetical protein
MRRFRNRRSSAEYYTPLPELPDKKRTDSSEVVYNIPERRNYSREETDAGSEIIPGTA